MSSAPEIAGYSYVRLLGRGGFSDVYLYHQQLPNRFVAIKVLRTDAISDALRRQFTAEANLMARVSTHPAIATVYAAGVDAAGQPYLVMEYCSGGSLGARFRQSPLAVADVLHIGVRLASALEAAHRSGIVHRDVKPANVLINDYGSAVLTDFGISAIDDEFPEATRIREQAYATQSNIGDVAATLGMSIPWAAPEGIDDEPRSDGRSDIFSLAGTLYTLLEGRSPFEVPGAANGAAQLIARIQSAALTPFQSQAVPENVREALRIGLTHEPAQRYGSARAFAERLQQCERELGLPATRIELAQAVPAADQPAALLPTDETAATVFPAATQVTPVPDPATPPAVPPTPAVFATPVAAASAPGRRLLIGGIVAALAVVALVFAVGIPWLSSLAAPEAPPTPAATQKLVIDGLDIDSDGEGSWTVTVPEDLAPPTSREGKVLSEGTSTTTVAESSRVAIGYDYASWDYGWDNDFDPPSDGSFRTATITAQALSAVLDVDVIGMPVGTVIIAAAPQGYFAQKTPLSETTMTSQIVVVRINALT